MQQLFRLILETIKHAEMMLDSGSAVSLVRQDIVKSCNTVSQLPFPQIQLVTASGDKLPITDYVRVPIEVQGNKLSHDFLVVNKLITPVILGIDFLQKHKLTLNSCCDIKYKPHNFPTSKYRGNQ